MAFPKKIFVKQVQDDGDGYLIADEEAAGLTVGSEADIEVAEYTLVRTGNLRTTTKFIGD